MYFSGWIDTDDPSTLSSSWVDSFAWHSQEIERDPSATDVGTFIIWIRNDGELRKYTYDGIEHGLFDELRRVAEHGGKGDSVGRTYNTVIKGNEDVPQATEMTVSEQNGDEVTASER